MKALQYTIQPVLQCLVYASFILFGASVHLRRDSSSASVGILFVLYTGVPMASCTLKNPSKTFVHGAACVVTYDLSIIFFHGWS